MKRMIEYWVANIESLRRTVINTSFTGVKTLRANTCEVTMNKQKIGNNPKTEEKQNHKHNQKVSEIAELVTALWPSSIYRRCYQRQQGKSPGAQPSLGN
ncbi:hypothetical protein TNCV_1932541 [Trichonephila clavipes]|nr:hypothetical protein TNCV_1932541 [Trichonephila clavipes]